MSRALNVWDLHPTLPLQGNEEIYAKVQGLELEVVKTFAEETERKDSMCSICHELGHTAGKCPSR